MLIFSTASCVYYYFQHPQSHELACGCKILRIITAYICVDSIRLSNDSLSTFQIKPQSLVGKFSKKEKEWILILFYVDKTLNTYLHNKHKTTSLNLSQPVLFLQKSFFVRFYLPEIKVVVK